MNNQGSPVAPEKLSGIYDPLVRIAAASVNSEANERTNLRIGLYISREIVHANGGQLKVTSTEGAGTTFTITLPSLEVEQQQWLCSKLAGAGGQPATTTTGDMMHHSLIQTVLASAVLFATSACVAIVHAAQPVPTATRAQADDGPVVRASAERLVLRWQLLRNVFTPDSPGGRALARLTLTNRDTRALPASGWALYFNGLDGVANATLKTGLIMEQVSGQLFRMRPAPGFAGVAPGASLDIDYFHRSVIIKPMMAPAGPYLVFDDAPEAGHRIGSYQIDVMSRPEQMPAGSWHRTPLSTPESVYATNARIKDIPAQSLAPVFPTPVQVQPAPGTLRLGTMPAIEADAALRNEADLARAMLGRYLAPGTAATAAATFAATPAASAGTAALRLRVAPVAGQSSPEAYSLTIDPVAGIELTGATPAGVFYGLQSLRDLLPLERGQGLALAAVRIVDAPRFGYRGFQLDVARNFFPKQTVFRLLDLMARYKLNKFHFHLTDDEGWRLAIAGLPELTTFGARRGHTLSVTEHLQSAYGSGPSVDDERGSGFYRREDYIEILKYAKARHIEVIPEIEMPGHARAAVKAMEQRAKRLERAGAPNPRQFLLHDAEDRSVYTSPQMYQDHVLNPGLESTYDFIAHVVADVVSMHKEAEAPLPSIHVGGDELPTGAWEQSPASRALMQRLKMTETAELWDYFYDRVDGILKRHGLFASGWEELGTRKVMLKGAPKMIPNPAFTQRGFRVQVWNNLHGAEDLAYRLANAGYQTVLSPVTNFYFDMAHNRNPDEPGVHWGAYIELERVFNFIPFDYMKNAPALPDNGPVAARAMDGLTDYGQRHIAGIEATLFSETVRDLETLDYLIMPRLLGLAERAWAPDPAWAREADATRAAALHGAAWSSFVNVLGKRVLPQLDADGSGIGYRIAPPGLVLKRGGVLVNHQLPGMTLRYTLDGSEPTAASPVVRGAIAARGLVRVAAFALNGRSGRSAQVRVP